ncbi:MAG: cytochrome C, partial [Chromatiales bacterium]|nr:cytochrome C [Chromatiales bacterium]
RSIPLGEEGYNSLMPWTMYADMTDADLGAIYTFLMQSEPRSNKVTIYE